MSDYCTLYNVDANSVHIVYCCNLKQNSQHPVMLTMMASRMIYWKDCPLYRLRSSVINSFSVRNGNCFENIISMSSFVSYIDCMPIKRLLSAKVQHLSILAWPFYIFPTATPSFSHSNSASPFDILFLYYLSQKKYTLRCRAVVGKLWNSRINTKKLVVRRRNNIKN